MKRTPLAALALLGLLSGCAPTPCTFADEPLGTLTDWEDAWLEAGGAPESPSFDTLTAEDGLALVSGLGSPRLDGRGPVAVLVPGSSSHSEHYAQLGATLSEDGVYTRILDVRGHGRSVCESATSCDAPDHTPRQPADDGRYYPGRVGDSADADQLVRDLDRHLTHLHDLWPDASAHLVGHSSGGGLVSRYVENTGASGLASVSLLAPYNHPDQPQVREAVRLQCERYAGTDYARLDLGALGDALRGNLHRYVLTFHKGDTLTDPLDTLAHTWATVQGMATRDPDPPGPPTRLHAVHRRRDHLLDPMESSRQVGRAAGPHRFVEMPDTATSGWHGVHLSDTRWPRTSTTIPTHRETGIGGPLGSVDGGRRAAPPELFGFHVP